MSNLQFEALWMIGSVVVGGLLVLGLILSFLSIPMTVAKGLDAYTKKKGGR